jgi:VIT1/CCC1 family predicted Fe2+/Mn2+ transporter
MLLLGKRINKFAIDPQNLSMKDTVSMIVCSFVGGIIMMFVTGYIISVLEKQGYLIKHGW